MRKPRKQKRSTTDVLNSIPQESLTDLVDSLTADVEKNLAPPTESLNELYEKVVAPLKANGVWPKKHSIPLQRVMTYYAIDTERNYQDSKWGKTLSDGRTGDGSRSVDEFVTYITGYTAQLLQVSSHYGSQQDKLEVVRKVAALCVACMEQHGAPQRKA